MTQTLKFPASLVRVFASNEIYLVPLSQLRKGAFFKVELAWRERRGQSQQLQASCARHLAQGTNQSRYTLC